MISIGPEGELHVSCRNYWSEESRKDQTYDDKINELLDLEANQKK